MKTIAMLMPVCCPPTRRQGARVGGGVYRRKAGVEKGQAIADAEHCLVNAVGFSNHNARYLPEPARGCASCG